MAGPRSNAPRRALMIVDVEPRFLNAANRHVIESIQRLILGGTYAAFVVGEHIDGPLAAAARRPGWRRTGRASDQDTVPELELLLDPRRTTRIVKTTRSLFGNEPSLATYLRRRRIRDVHIAGLETHDCVLATALDSFDYGFITCVIEEASASKRAAHHRAGLAVLRKLHLTNHSMRL
jgi:nicotinamidase-related amidase